MCIIVLVHGFFDGFVQWVLLEMDHTRLNIVDCPDDRGKRLCAMTFELTELLTERRHAVLHIGCHTLMYQCLSRTATVQRNLFFRFVPQVSYNGSDMLRFAFLHLMCHCFHRPAAFMPHDDYRMYIEMFNSIFDARQHIFFVCDIACIADDKQIANAFIENDFRRYPRV